MLRVLGVLGLSLCLFCATLDVAQAAPKKVLRVQLVLVALQSGRAIPPKAADVILDHLSAKIPGFTSKKVLRGDTRLILDFLAPPEQQVAVQTAIDGLVKTSAGSFVKVEAWKPVIEEVSDYDTNVPITPPPGDDAVNKSTTSNREKPVVNFRFETIEEGSYKIVARNVEVGVLLEALSGAREFSYVCPQEVWQRRLTINVRRTSFDGLLSALKGALSLSVTRVGSLYILAPISTVP